MSELRRSPKKAMPLLMLVTMQIFALLGLAVVVLLYLLLSKNSMRLLRFRKSVVVGMCISPIGLVAPYLLFAFLVLICGGTWPTNGMPVIDMFARVFVGFLPILGPCVGPWIVLLVTVILYPKKKGGEPGGADNSGAAPLRV